MRKSLILVFALVVFGFCTNASAAVPTCVLGGPTAMDTNRQLAEGESFVLTNRPLVVNLQFRPTKKHPERVGECMLLTGTEVAVKNGILQWVRKCGNDEVNRNVFVIPFRTIHGRRGSQGPKGIKGDLGPQGPPGQDAVLLIPPPSPLKWGLTGGVSRGSYSGPIADRELCQIDSWTANLGVTYGDPYRFFGRLTAMAVLIDDGSSSNYVCANCGTVVAVSNGMKVFGGNLEIVGLIGPRNWKIQPTLYLEGGGGVVQGQVDRYVTRSGSTTVQRVDAEEFFGYKGLAHGGGGAGLTWHASSNVSVEAFGKYRYPYGTSVGISLTKWLGK